MVLLFLTSPPIHYVSAAAPDHYVFEEQVEPTHEVIDSDVINVEYLQPNCSCVVYLQEQGVELYGDAIDLNPNYFGSPERGDVVLLHYPDKENPGDIIGHAALVEASYPGGMWVSEDNFRKCQHTQRLVKWDDPYIYGYVRANNPYEVDITNSKEILIMDDDKPVAPDQEEEVTPQTDETEDSAE